MRREQTIKRKKIFSGKIASSFFTKEHNVAIALIENLRPNYKYDYIMAISHINSLLNVINLDLQEPRTKEAIEYIKRNIDSAKTNIFKTKELQDCMKYL